MRGGGGKDWWAELTSLPQAEGIGNSETVLGELATGAHLRC